MDSVTITGMQEHHIPTSTKKQQQKIAENITISEAKCTVYATVEGAKQ